MVTGAHPTNRVGTYSGAAALASALLTNTTLRELYLPDTNVGDKGAEALATALKSNTTLVNIDLASNYINNKGARLFSSVLEVNKTLKKVDLTNTYVSSAAIGGHTFDVVVAMAASHLAYTPNLVKGSTVALGSADGSRREGVR